MITSPHEREVGAVYVQSDRREALSEAGRSTAVLEVTSGGPPVAPRFSCSRWLSDVARAKRVPPLERVRSCLPELEAPRSLRACLTWLEAETGGRYAVSAGRLARLLRQTRRMVRAFRWELQRFRPAVGFVYAYYTHEGFAFCQACHELGITTVDVQHGGQGDLHFAYHEWSQHPPGGYGLLPRVFWTWSEREATTIRGWAARSAGAYRALPAGNLLLRRYAAGDRLDDHDAQLSARARPGERQVVVALGLEPTEDVLELIESAPPGIRWWIRFHPRFTESLERVQRRFAGRGDVEVELPTRASLYGLLSVADVVLTEGSGVTLEARDRGVPVILTDAQLAQHFEDLLAEGSARLVTDHCSWLEALREARPWPPRQLGDPAALSEALALGARR